MTSLQPPGCSPCDPGPAVRGGHWVPDGPYFRSSETDKRGQLLLRWYDAACNVVDPGTGRVLKTAAAGGHCTRVTATVLCPEGPTDAPSNGSDPGASCDAAKLITLHVAGDAKVKGQPFKVYTEGPAAWITYTPKQSAVDEKGKAIDAKNHGRDLTRWVIADGQRVLIPDTLAGEDSCVPVGPIKFCGHVSGESLFNATIVGVRPGSYQLSARLRCGGRELWSNVEADGQVIAGPMPGAETAPGGGGGGGRRPGRKPRR